MTDTDDVNWGFIDFQKYIFPEAFFDELGKGASYGKAWMAGDKSIDKLLHYFYIPGMKNYFRCFYPKEYEKLKNCRLWWFYYWCFWQMKIRKDNPLIDDNGDGKPSGTWKVDRLPIGGDGILALNTYP